MNEDHKFEILVKTGRSEYGWDNIKYAYCRTIQGAKDYRAIELEKNPQATVVIRNAATLMAMP